MTYRDFCGEKCSLLGFGAMRYPTTEDGKINEPEAERMLDAAYAAGVTYFDTAYPYHSGASEPFTGRVLSKYPRDSFLLATKLPMWKVTSAEEAERIFYEQLDRLGTDYVDFYLFHALNGGVFREKVLGYGLIPVFERLQKEGKIRHLGFSFHDSYAAFEEIITYRKWDFCQIQYNYMDTEENPGDRGYALAESLGVPLAIMEPIRGGMLVQFPDEIKTELAAITPDRNLADWALSWVATHPNARVVLSGMSTMEQVEDNLSILGGFRPLTAHEQAGLKSVVETIRARVKNGCTGCRYCMPCPFGVNIPRVFRAMNEYSMYGSNKKRYARSVHGENGEGDPSLCHACGACEKKCPQNLEIIKDLKCAADMFKD